MGEPFERLSLERLSLERLSEAELRDHATWLLRLARRLVASEPAAADLAQDVWLELARGAGPVAHLRAFMARVARRLAGHRRRADRSRGARERSTARGEALPGPEELESALETQRILLQELAALDEAHRRPLMLSFHECLSAAEIARRSGLPASTVRSQIQRALAALRERLDRRHGGERSLWVALFLRLPDGTWRPELVATGGGLVAVLGKTVLAAGAAGVLVLAWRASVERERVPVALAPAEEPPRPLAAPLRADADEVGAVPDRVVEREPLGSPGERGEPASGDVPLQMLDAATGEPLADLWLELRARGKESASLVTDAGGRATIASEWFEAPFHLSSGDDQWENDEGFELGLAPEDRPAEGETLVLRCAVGPSYTLLFDGPTPPLAELYACLARGKAPPSDPRKRARLHLDGTRVWTRFGPAHGIRTPMGDEPWTLAVLAEDGLWRAFGPVTAIAGVQAEPVRLRSETCGVLEVRLESAGGPVEGQCGVSLERREDGEVAQSWHYYGLLPRGQTTVSGMPEARGKGFRTVRFTHLEPGSYRVSAGSTAHERARRELRIAAGVVERVTLDVPRKAGLGDLRVVITSETGMRNLMLADVSVRESATRVLRSPRYSPESTALRRVLLVEAPLGVDLELSLDGLESLGSLEWSPGRTAVARAGDEFVFTCLDSGLPPARAAEVRVLTRDGLPIREAGVTTYFGETPSFLHQTDAEGRALLEPIQEGTPFDVVAVADAYRPMVLRALTLTRDGEVFDVRLEPGWGAWLDVAIQPSASGDGGRAAGARVLLDGVDAGRLDERGQILLAGDHAPRAIEILHPDHRILHGDIDPVTFAPRAHANGPYWVVLERLER